MPPFMPAIIARYGIEPVVKMAAVLAAVVFLFVGGCRFGGVRVQAKWDAANKDAEIVAAHVEAKQAAVTTQVVTEYVDRIKVVRQRGADVVKEVTKYVPSDSCPLPGGFRLLHDAAARGVPLGPGVTDARAVPAQDAAATVTSNYSTCLEMRTQLIALQGWVAKQAEASQ